MTTHTELRYLLTSMGEKMNDEEADEFMKASGADGDNKINLEALINKLLK